MRYAPPGMCLNDFSIERTADAYHVVHLQGPWNDRFDERCMETSYGHARSTDLIEWETLGPCFGVGGPGSFDASAIWTMHTFPCAGGTAMAYTGVAARPWADQAIGLAFTDRADATGWMRVMPRPVVVPDPRWYVTGRGMAWRDPFVVRERGRWAMAVSAAGAGADPAVAGCIALAVSDDLLRWEVAPPLLPPGATAELECPVLERVGTGWVLLACLSTLHQIHAWSAESLDGPWHALGPVAPPGPYAPRLIDGPAGERLLLHTSQRRTGLRNDGLLCRGALAQPKVFDVSDPRGPRLRWWRGTEQHLTARPVDGARLGLVDVAVDAGARILLRGTASSPELVLDCRDGGVSLVGAAGAVRASARIDAHPRRIKVLQIGECIEVYADDILVLSELDYRPPARPAMLGGRTVSLPVRPLRRIGPDRDDVSALPAPGPGHTWVLPGDSDSHVGSGLVGRIRLRSP